MAKKIGDKLTTEIRRAGLTDVKVQIDRGSGAVLASLIPSSDGTFVEEEVSRVGLNNVRHVLYYQQTITLQFLQTDSETLADLYSTALASQWATGVSTQITFLNGKTITITMTWSKKFHGEGYDSPLAVELIGTSRTIAPVMR